MLITRMILTASVTCCRPMKKLPAMTIAANQNLELTRNMRAIIKMSGLTALSTISTSRISLRCSSGLFSTCADSKAFHSISVARRGLRL